MAFVDLFNFTMDQFEGQTNVTIGQVLGDEEIRSAFLETFNDNVIFTLDLGLNITHLNAIVQEVAETPYAGQLSKFYFEGEQE